MDRLTNISAKVVVLLVIIMFILIGITMVAGLILALKTMIMWMGGF